ncbi:MAG: nicotinate phosphoribosyltransferase [Kiloniellales bacterium]
MPRFGFPGTNPGASLLLTDLYELNMMQAYLEAGMTETAVFEFFVRKLPPGRGFFMAAGLEQVVQFLEEARFSAQELDWLGTSGRFSRDLIDHLADLRFTGDLRAMAEGTVFFPNEPILRLSAPLPEAQLLESRLINLLHFECLIASKAARMVLAAPGKTLVDFGLRRAHGAEAGLLAARAAYLAGFAASATTLAAPVFGLPISGTMAHSFIQAHDDEETAFLRFARSRPDAVVLLLDTYDTEAAAEIVVRLAPRLRDEGITVRGVRLDSGDLAEHARRVRRILDDGGLEQVEIFASGGIDEWSLTDFVRQGAPIDGYGIGTSLTTSSDAPALDCAYKLQVYAGQPKRKRSEGKATWPGRKQVFRRYDAAGTMAGDLLTLEGDAADGEALIAPVLRGGKRIDSLPSLDQVRRHAAAELARLPEALRAPDPQETYEVTVSEPLKRLAENAYQTVMKARN